MNDLERLKFLFEEVNEAAKGTELEHLTIDDINAEIKAYRLEKKLRDGENYYPLTSAPSL